MTAHEAPDTLGAAAQRQPQIAAVVTVRRVKVTQGEQRRKQNQKENAQQAQPAPKKRVKLKHAALVNGIIMAEVLGKPRALNPYEER